MSRRPGRRQFHQEPTVPFNTRIPQSLHTRIELLLTDPNTGEIPYGAKTQLIEKLLTAWIKDQQRIHTRGSDQPGTQGPVFTPDQDRYSGKGS